MEVRTIFFLLFTFDLRGKLYHFARIFFVPITFNLKNASKQFLVPFAGSSHSKLKAGNMKTANSILKLSCSIGVDRFFGIFWTKTEQTAKNK